jgi:hypothetical protein
MMINFYGRSVGAFHVINCLWWTGLVVNRVINTAQINTSYYFTIKNISRYQSDLVQLHNIKLYLVYLREANVLAVRETIAPSE